MCAVSSGLKCYVQSSESGYFPNDNKTRASLAVSLRSRKCTRAQLCVAYIYIYICERINSDISVCNRRPHLYANQVSAEASRVRRSTADVSRSCDIEPHNLRVRCECPVLTVSCDPLITEHEQITKCVRYTPDFISRVCNQKRADVRLMHARYTFHGASASIACDCNLLQLLFTTVDYSEMCTHTHRHTRTLTHIPNGK